MDGSDPKQVIVDWLARPSVVTSESPVLGEGGWRGQRRQGGHDADPTTIRFLKERSIPGYQLHAVMFENGSPYAMRMIVGAAQDAAGAWRVRGGAGGGGDAPIREHPWVNLGGWGWSAEFRAGGHVVNNGLDIAIVRLVAGNGLTLEDTVDDGLVLFVTDQRVELPIQAELYDRSGMLVAHHEAIPDLRCETPPT